MGETKIEWADFTFNPWEGCTKVSPGCDNCYAEARDKRFTGGALWGAKAPRRRTSAANWKKPRQWNRQAQAAGERHRVFCASLADVFDTHASILPEWRADLWDLIRATPNLDWMLLTKRPGNIAKMLPDDWGRGYPNVWLGCTVVNQKEADRDVPKLLAVPARIRFLSMEPLLGPVDLEQAWHGESALDSECWGDCAWCEKGFPPLHNCHRGKGDWERGRSGLDLVIVGGESGPGARPMHPDWARSLRDQCVAAGVAFHFKQWGEWAPGENCGDVVTGYRANASWWDDEWLFCETNMADPEADWHDEPDLYRVGKKAAGRLLDGRTWDQMPLEGEA